MVRLAVGEVFVGGGKFTVLGPDGVISISSLYFREPSHLLRLTLGSTPAALSDIESTSDFPGINLARLRIHEHLFCLHHRARLSLIIHTQNLASDLELATLTGHWDRLQELELALTIEYMLCVKLGYACDRRAVRARVEVDNFGVGVLEWEYYRVGRERGEVGIEFLLNCEFCNGLQKQVEMGRDSWKLLPFESHHRGRILT